MSPTTWRGPQTAMVPDDGRPARPINDVMQFEGVVQVHPDGSLTERDDLHAPELMQYKGDDDVWREDLSGEGWSLLTGWTGQYGYRGPMMHASEYLGGRLAEHVLGNPGLYVLLVPSVVDPDDEDAQADSWAIAFKDLP
jgi:hypothetical protein